MNHYYYLKNHERFDIRKQPFLQLEPDVSKLRSIHHPAITLAFKFQNIFSYISSHTIQGSKLIIFRIKIATSPRL